MVVIKNLLIGLRNESVISKIRTESETGEEALTSSPSKRFLLIIF